LSKTFRALNRGESAGDSKQLAAELEAARDARVRAWRYVFDCYAKKRTERAREPGEIDPEINRTPAASASLVTPKRDRR
jgi:hypothetical protein